MNKKNVSSTALAGLIGHYGSGDSSDESGDEKNVDGSTPYANHSKWSICVDPATGCPYYWNQITNEVSWEPPRDFETIPVRNKQQAKSNSTFLSKLNNSKPKIKSSKDTTKKDDSIESVTKPKKRRTNSSEDEEKIELITSYYNSDSASGDDNADESGKTSSDNVLNKKNQTINVKSGVTKASKTSLIVPVKYGPELPSEFLKSNSPPKSVSSISPLFPAFQNKTEDLAKSTDSDELKKDTDTLKILKQNEGSLEKKVFIPSPNEISKDEQSKEAVSSSANDEKSNINTLETVSDLDKSSTPLETENLEKLMSTQASLLKKLGKLEPEEIKYLNGSTANSPIMNSRTHSPIISPDAVDSLVPLKKSTALDMDVDDLIAQIEMEQPIDQPLVVSDTLSTETIHSQDGSATNKSTYVTEEDSSGSKTDTAFKPLFPSTSFMQPITENSVDEEKRAESTEANVNNSENDVKTEPSVEKNIINKYEIMSGDGIENSAFKRKRRIALDIFSTKKQMKPEDLQAITFTTKYSKSDDPSTERKGLGFNKTENSSDLEENKINYLNFKKGEAILFQKGDTLNSDQIESKQAENMDKENKETSEESENTEEKKKTIEAKLKFLVQSLPPVPPVQQLFIELQTLWGARMSGALQNKHMHEWLHNADTTLDRLEASAAPHPWICRFHSVAGCYVYEHAETGQWQWEYPEPDVPPPPPTPPPVKPPTPPPDEPTDMDISTTPPPPSNVDNDDIEPLPPGIETPMMVTLKFNQSSSKLNNITENCVESTQDNLCAEINSFYSDLAALEDVPPQPLETRTEKTVIKEKVKPETLNSIQSSNVAPKEKKKKVKVNTPSSLKNKNVSKLVAKWKKVQETLDE